MALKQVLMASKIAKLRAQMEPIKSRAEELKAQRADLAKKEAQLEAATREVNENTPAEDQQELEQQVEECVQQVEQVEQQQQETQQQLTDLEEQVQSLTEELEAISNTDPIDNPDDGGNGEDRSRRKEDHKMVTRKFFNLSAQERDAFFADKEVQGFCQRLREMGKQTRSVTGGDLLIPTVVLDIVREQVAATSKLIGHVNHKIVQGKARQNVMGAIPEAVWTEMTGTLNELTFAFTGCEVDGYKVGGIVYVPNATLEDADNVDLATEVINGIAKAIAKALDKAILYGTGTKMPLGIVTRLLQESKPTGYPTTERAWVDLHTTNITTITAANSAGIKLFQQILTAAAAADPKYSNGQMVWAMSRKTLALLKVEAMSINAAGAIVSGMEGTMPVIGGTVEEIETIPDNVIIGGYGDGYLLAERAGINLEQTRDYKFAEDMTAYRGTARYDGKPIIAEAFVAIGIKGTTVAAQTFATDAANTVQAQPGVGG